MFNCEAVAKRGSWRDARQYAKEYLPWSWCIDGRSYRSVPSGMFVVSKIVAVA